MSWFDITPGKVFVSYTEIDRGKLYLFDNNLSSIDTITIDHNAPENPAPYMMVDPFDYSFQNGSERRLLFSSYMSDTIWDISNGRKNVGYILNLGDKLLPEKYRYSRFKGDFDRFQKVAAPYQKVKLMDTPSCLFIFQKGWTEQELNSIYIHDTAENTTHKYETPYIFDDLVGKRNLVPRYSSDNCIIATITPIELKEELKNKGIKFKSGENAPSPLWIEQMEKVKEDDNQILVLIPVRNKR
ncbi:MAG: hypothetical protein MI975_21085 [Cytophagales bacterium]|nr:hypothetical protein [Cytophagales bacterium]